MTTQMNDPETNTFV